MARAKTKRNLFYVVCHNIRSAFNIGSIFRTADALGVDKIILGGYTPVPPHQKIAKVALGSERFIPYEKTGQTWRALKKLKRKGFNVIALEQAPEAIDFFKFKPKFPIALVLGPERSGLSKEILKYCDDVVYIPMYGKKESLNVSVAFGVAGYQINYFKK